MQTLTLSHFEIEHDNGVKEKIDAESALKAIQSIQVSETESKIKYVMRFADNIKVVVDDLPTEIACVVSVDTGTATDTGCIATPSTITAHSGDTVEFKAIAGDGWQFKGWYKGLNLISVDATMLREFTDDDTTLNLTAKFEPADITILTTVYPAGSGSVFVSTNTVKPNTEFKFLAIESNSDYEFSHWERNGVIVSEDKEATITVSPKTSGESNVNYIAVFEEK